jgi:predicted DNA-binding protein with PD1-like motif
MTNECDHDKILLRLDRGDKIIESILAFCKAENITGGWFFGLGATDDATLASYDLDNKKYIEKDFKGKFEITSLTGNIAKLDNETVLHTHINIADEEFRVYGGHLKEATVSITCEIVLEPNATINREFDANTGLNLIK